MKALICLLKGHKEAFEGKHPELNIEMQKSCERCGKVLWQLSLEDQERLHTLKNLTRAVDVLEATMSQFTGTLSSLSMFMSSKSYEIGQFLDKFMHPENFGKTNEPTTVKIEQTSNGKLANLEMMVNSQERYLESLKTKILALQEQMMNSEFE